MRVYRADAGLMIRTSSRSRHSGRGLAPAHSRAHLLSRHLPAGLLPGAAAHQRVGPHLDERPRRLLACARHKTLATLGATTYVLGSALATMPMSLWMAQGRPPPGFMTGALDQRRRLRARRVRVAMAQLRAVLRGHRSHRHLQRDRPAVPVRRGRGRGARATRRGRSRSCSPAASSAASSARRPRDSRAISSPRRSWARSWCWRSYALVALAVQSRVRVPRPSLDERTGAAGRCR